MIRYYLGKYKVRVLESISNKSYVEFLEKGIVGNKKVGYREVPKGERVFLYTRNCYKREKQSKWFKKEMKRLEEFSPYDEIYNAFFRNQFIKYGEGLRR